MQPDVEIARFLTEKAGFANTPAFLGSVEYRPAEGDATMLAVAFAFVRNQGDAWSSVTDALHRDMQEHAVRSEESEAVDGPAPFIFPLAIGDVLGQRTAELHAAFATETDDPDFRSEPIGAEDVAVWVRETKEEVGRTVEMLRAGRSGLEASVGEAADALLKAEKALMKRIDAASKPAPQGNRTRIHGDYHLGQLLVAKNDLMIIDFEGEPRRSVAERRAKSSPLRDVAGMLRSLDYAAATAERTLDVTAGNEAAPARLQYWRESAQSEFLAAYFAQGEDGRSGVEDAPFARALLDLFLIQKAAYEIGYELANRPTWVDIPLRGLLDILAREPA